MLSNNTIETIKNIVKIKDIVENYVHLKKSGNKYVGCCPFHNERTPSFFISEEGNFYKCFGCGQAGDSIDFIERIENVTFLEAIEIIGKKYNIKLEVDNIGNDSEDEIKYKEKKTSEIILKAAEKLFKENLRTENVAIEYLKERNLNEEIINTFNLGYSNGNLANHLEKNKYNIELAKKLGLIKYNKIESFKNRITIPIRDTRNTIIGFGARIINKGTEEPKYINSNESILFHKNNVLFNCNIAKSFIFKENNAYLVEGYFDVISLYKIDIKNVIASCGTSLTDNQCLLLKKYTKTVTVFYDNDQAGNKATIRAINKLLKNGLMVNIISFNDYKDPDEIISKLDKEKAKSFIKNSETNIIDFLLLYFNYKNETNINKKNDILHFINGVISLTKDDIYKNLLTEKLKEATKINVSNKPKTNKIQFNKYSDNEIIEQYENEIITTLIKCGEKNCTKYKIISELMTEVDNYTFKNKVNEKIFQIIKTFFYSDKEITQQTLINEIEDNEAKNKVINCLSNKYDNIVSNWIKHLNIDPSDLINKSDKNINILLLKAKLYNIRCLIKEKKNLIKSYYTDKNKDNLINEIIKLKNEEIVIANTLKIVIL